MNKIYGILLLGFLLIGCNENKANKKVEQNKPEQNVEFNKNLAKELAEMAVTDQLAASNAFPPKKYSQFSQKKWEAFKDSIFRSNQKRIAEIFKKYGFVGYDIAGKSGSNDFWLIVQHSDHNPDFQKKVLKKMKIEVEKGNADSQKYGLLVDRVKLNTGEKQIYGSQVTYNPKTGQAYPRKLSDSATVNQRRKAIGLEPLEIYLNKMTIMHFNMNKEYFSKKGITEPKLYKTKK